MVPETQVLLSVGIPTLAVLVGILLNAQRTDRLEKHMDAQLASFRAEIKAEIQSLRSEMNARFETVDARFEAVEAHFEAAHQALLRVEGVMDARLRQVEDRE